MGRSGIPARLALLSTLLALVVITLGAYVRLSDAGLGCPDWPGCYGQMVAPSSERDLARLNAEFPAADIDTAKAWKEMIHRYAAGALGLAIAAMALLAWRSGRQRTLPSFLLVLVVLQALLGMWTVTLLLKPAIVTLHLVAGMATLALLWWLTLQRSRWPEPAAPRRPLRVASLAALLVLTVQIGLGGWTSSNYAAFFCPDFPTCQGRWWPSADFAAGFALWQPGVRDYSGGLLQHEAGVAVHLAHRLGALATLAVVAWLGLRQATAGRSPWQRALGMLLILAVAGQFALGAANVLLRLPLALAVSHNGLAAVILLLVVTATYWSWHTPRPEAAAGGGKHP